MNLSAPKKYKTTFSSSSVREEKNLSLGTCIKWKTIADYSEYIPVNNITLEFKF